MISSIAQRQVSNCPVSLCDLGHRFVNSMTPDTPHVCQNEHIKSRQRLGVGRYFEHKSKHRVYGIHIKTHSRAGCASRCADDDGRPVAHRIVVPSRLRLAVFGLDVSIQGSGYSDRWYPHVSDAGILLFIGLFRGLAVAASWCQSHG